MAVFNGAFPVLPGKERASRDLAAARMGEHRNGFEFTSWFRGQVKDLTGVDLSARPDSPPPEVRLDWNA
jgi:hypothetical protein